jgi:hypothetical protein
VYRVNNPCNGSCLHRIGNSAAFPLETVLKAAEFLIPEKPFLSEDTAQERHMKSLRKDLAGSRFLFRALVNPIIFMYVCRRLRESPEGDF